MGSLIFKPWQRKDFIFGAIFSSLFPWSISVNHHAQFIQIILFNLNYNSVLFLLQVHGSPEFLSCPICTNKYRTKNGLKLHCETIHEKKRKKEKCKICFKEYGAIGDLNHHVKVTHREKKLSKCDICFKTFLTILFI